MSDHSTGRIVAFGCRRCAVSSHFPTTSRLRGAAPLYKLNWAIRSRREWRGGLRKGSQPVAETELSYISDAEAKRFQDQMYALPHYNYDGATEWPGLIRKLNRECPGYDR